MTNLLTYTPGDCEIPKEFGILAFQIAQWAIDIIRSSANFSTEWKSDGTPVTEIDKLVNAYVINSIRAQFSNHHIHWEEQSSEWFQSDYKWICDPIDGTIPFSLWFPFFSFSLALIYKGEPIIWVVAIPYENKIIYAEKWKWTYCNDIKVSVKESREINYASYIFTENWGGSKYDTTWFIQLLSHWKYNAKVFWILSIVYAWVQVALWKVDAVIFPGTTVHDVAALAVIIKEAWWIVSDIHWRNQRYDGKIVDGFLGVTPWVKPQILEILSSTLITKL